MKELVVGLDGSEHSRRALRWAAALAARADVPLRVVESWSYPALAVLPGWPELVPPNEMDERTMIDLQDAVGAVLGDDPSSVTVEALRGPAATAILATVDAESVLVLGTRGRGGFAGLLLGSVSRECIEYAPCPVVVVRDDRPPADGDGDGVILVGKDGSDNAARALDWAESIRGLTGAPIVAAYAWQTTSSEVNPRLHARLRAEAQSTIEGWLAERPPAGSVQEEGEPRAKLVEFAERLGARLVVVGRRGTSAVRGLTAGSVTSYLVGNSPTTVAVIPPDGATAD